MAFLGGGDEAVEFGLHGVAGGVGEGSGVELDHVGAGLAGGFDLFEIRIDEEAHADAGVLQAGDDHAGFVETGEHVESALGGDFHAVFRHEADELGLEFQREADHFLGHSHFEIQRNLISARMRIGIGILHVAAVAADVDGERIRTTGERVVAGQRPGRVRHSASPALSRSGPGAGWRCGRC